MDNEGHNWYDDIDAATLQRIKTYSAFCDYKSQNLMLQTLYEAMQKKIDEYKQTNRGIAKDYADLQKQVKELKEGLAVGSTWNKALNSMNKALEEERDKYRNMVFDKDEQLAKAKKIIKNLMVFAEIDSREYEKEYKEAEQFLKEVSE